MGCAAWHSVAFALTRLHQLQKLEQLLFQPGWHYKVNRLRDQSIVWVHYQPMAGRWRSKECSL